jgi:hypothetical protein
MSDARMLPFSRCHRAYFEDFFRGIFAPELGASLRAIATACLRLFYFAAGAGFQASLFDLMHTL